jgi:Subtilase family
MTPSRHPLRVAAIFLVPLSLARCSEAPSPTGWIPSNGTISGVITVTSAPLAPRHAAPRGRTVSSVGGTVPVLPAAPSIKGSALRKMASPPPGGRPPAAGRAMFTPNDLIITFRHTALGAPPVGTAALAAAASGAGALAPAIRAHLAAVIPAGVEVVGVSPAILTAKIRLADTTQRGAVAAALSRDPAIAAVTRNGLIWLEGTSYRSLGTSGAAATTPGTTPNDPFYPFQSWHYGLIDLPRAWSITRGSAAILVAVVDDGIRFDHLAIAANLTSDGYDFVNPLDSLTLCAGGRISNADDGDGYDPNPTIPASYHLNSTGTCFIPDTLGAHGLHVAGTIGAVGNDGVGVTGVNWTVRIRPVRALGVGGFGSDYDIAQGILYAAGLPADNGAGGTVRAGSGAKIINLSLGGPSSDTTLHNAIISAANAGALIVAAA